MPRSRRRRTTESDGRSEESIGDLTLQASPASATVARAWLRAALAGRVPTQVLDDSLLVIGELVANSIEHTHSRHLVVGLTLEPRRLVIRVHDQGYGLPAAWPVPGHRGRSRGLMMIGKLTTSLSSRPDSSGGSIITAVLALPRP